MATSLVVMGKEKRTMDVEYYGKPKKSIILLWDIYVIVTFYESTIHLYIRCKKKNLLILLSQAQNVRTKPNNSIIHLLLVFVPLI